MKCLDICGAVCRTNALAKNRIISKKEDARSEFCETHVRFCWNSAGPLSVSSSGGLRSLSVRTESGMLAVCLVRSAKANACSCSAGLFARTVSSERRAGRPGIGLDRAQAVDGGATQLWMLSPVDQVALERGRRRSAVMVTNWSVTVC